VTFEGHFNLFTVKNKDLVGNLRLLLCVRDLLSVKFLVLSSNLYFGPKFTAII